MGTKKTARASKGASTSYQPILRNYTTKELSALAEPHPWPTLGRKGNRAAQKALAEAIDQLADEACTVAYNASFAESMRLKYPSRSGHFLRMFFRAMKEQIRGRMRGSGVRL